MIFLSLTYTHTHQDGGFYSAEDADSYPSTGSDHKKEGAFCVWTSEETSSLLTDPLPGSPERTTVDLFSFHYGVEKDGNVKPQQVRSELRI